LFITQVENNSPADKGGLLSGDIIYAFNDQAVETSDQLFKLLTEDKVVSFNSSAFLRNNQKKELRVTPAEGDFVNFLNYLILNKQMIESIVLQ